MSSIFVRGESRNEEINYCPFCGEKKICVIYEEEDFTGIAYDMEEEDLEVGSVSCSNCLEIFNVI